MSDTTRMILVWISNLYFASCLGALVFNMHVLYKEHKRHIQMMALLEQLRAIHAQAGHAIDNKDYYAADIHLQRFDELLELIEQERKK